MPDPRPQKRQSFGVINQTGLTRINTFDLQTQIRIVVGEFISSTPFSNRAMRIALASWMRESLASADPESVPPPMPADTVGSRRLYWRTYYATHRDELNASRRSRYQRARQQFGVQ